MLAMDFEPTPEMENIRAEIREVLAAVLPPDWQGSGFISMEVKPEHMALAHKIDKGLAAKKLLAPAWPEEYGGRGLTPYEQFALYEELGFALVPRPTNISVDCVGPVLMLYGSDEQRRQHLPAIAEEGVIWSQGFSEPGAGSDLTSLRTRAERKGDFYIVNGQKIWTSFAHLSQWMVLLARTSTQESRGRGLSLLLVPVDVPGLQIRPIHDAVGEHTLNEVFFENVQIPIGNLVGNENEGWRYATTFLQYERGEAIFLGQCRRLLDDLEKELSDRRFGHHDSFVAKSLLAQREIDYGVARLFALRVVDMHAKGQFPDMEASVAKLFMSESIQRLAHTAHHLAGLRGNLPRKDALAPLGGRIGEAVIASAATTILSGTSEIQRNIIATRGLGLPRG
jgi:alkylation response protein AidB-like acyl-CoA dehydrogenase